MDNLHKINNMWVVWKKTVYLIVGFIVLFWFLSTVKTILVLFLTSFIFTLVLNPIVTKLEEWKIPRVAGAISIVVFVIIFIGLLLWLMIPSLVNELSNLVNKLPNYFSQLSEKLLGSLSNYPEIRQQITTNIVPQLQKQVFSEIQSFLPQIGRYFVSITDSFIFLATFVGVIVYSLISPRPLLKFYLELFPPHLQQKAKTAFILGYKATIGWMWASLIIGFIQGILAAIFLFFLGIPAAIVWAVLTFISQFVPRYGPIIMTIPPALIALSIDPLKAVWVILFYLVLNEVTEDIFAPYIRSAQMTLHPVLIIFAVLAVVYAIGLLGALIATPLASFAKAFYQQFYLSETKEKNIDPEVEQILSRKLSKK